MKRQGEHDIRNFDSPSESILDSPQLRDFIEKNRSADTLSLRLKTAGKPWDFDLDFAIMQIDARTKSHGKLATFTSNPDFMFPSELAAQQASHQEVASFHVTLVGSGQRILDMTAGLGIDALSFAMADNEVTALDIDSWKSEVLRHNSRVLGVEMKVECDDSVNAVVNEFENDEFDWIFVDPARRGEEDRRLYAIADCHPNILPILPRMFEIAPRIMIKASPMLDLSEAVRSLPGIDRIAAVSRRGECKELLIILRRERVQKVGNSPILLQAVNITAEGIDNFETSSIPDPEGGLNLSSPEKETVISEKWLVEALTQGSLWLYEPNASVMKLGCWKELTNRWPSLIKADRNTHLFLSLHPIEDFPGRGIKLIKRIGRKDFKSLHNKKITVVSRNFPESADSIRKRLGLREGIEECIYAFRLNGKPVMLGGIPV